MNGRGRSHFPSRREEVSFQGLVDGGRLGGTSRGQKEASDSGRRNIDVR